MIQKEIILSYIFNLCLSLKLCQILKKKIFLEKLQLNNENKMTTPVMKKCKGVRSLTHCWLECELVQSFGNLFCIFQNSTCVYLMN